MTSSTHQYAPRFWEWCFRVGRSLSCVGCVRAIAKVSESVQVIMVSATNSVSGSENTRGRNRAVVLRVASAGAVRLFPVPTLLMPMGLNRTPKKTVSEGDVLRAGWFGEVVRSDADVVGDVRFVWCVVAGVAVRVWSSVLCFVV